MRVDAFDYPLPEELIALRPASPRDAARLLVVDPSAEPPFADRMILDLPELLEPGDALAFNDTEVIPAELRGVRTRNDNKAQITVTLTERLDANRWLALARPAKRLKQGDRILFGEGGDVCLLGTLAATVEARGREGEVTLAFDFSDATLAEAIARFGEMPLPPYIASRRPADAQDRVDYQTSFAREEGAVAAPTAGLHFDEEILNQVKARGATVAKVTLHVGFGTFQPVRGGEVEAHRMHSERYRISSSTMQAIKGRRVLAVGTTALRALESAHLNGKLEGETDLFIYPGFKFQVVKRLLTNFHLPKSTLLMLVSAFAGLENIRKAYAHAIAERYRFFSYGDAMLIDS
jgi:S-adenosylmethionine:tRNA ribosyltransferase-isomerase